MRSNEWAVSYTQDWSDPKRALEEIEQATVARDRRTTDDGWFERMFKREAAATPAQPPAEPATPVPRTRRPRRPAGS